MVLRQARASCLHVGRMPVRLRPSPECGSSSLRRDARATAGPTSPAAAAISASEPSGLRLSSRATPLPTFVRVPPRRGSPFCPAVMLVCLRFVAVVIGGVSGNRSSRAGQCGLREASDRRRLRSPDPRSRVCVVVVESLRFEQRAGSRRSRTRRAAHGPRRRPNHAAGREILARRNSCPPPLVCFWAFSKDFPG